MLNETAPSGLHPQLRMTGVVSGRGVQYTLDKDPIPGGWVIHRHMGYRAHQFAVLDDRTAGHADVKYGTKKFCVFLQI